VSPYPGLDHPRFHHQQAVKKRAGTEAAYRFWMSSLDSTFTVSVPPESGIEPGCAAPVANGPREEETNLFFRVRFECGCAIIFNGKLQGDKYTDSHPRLSVESHRALP
jgi:hypothetical protein